jgi:hypothetical protein
MAPVLVDADFPGGNIAVDAVEIDATAEDTIRLHQELRDTGRDWFYWYFRVRGAAGRTVRFVFTASQAIGALGPAVSTDGGSTWSWLGCEAVEGNSFVFDTTSAEVRFSFGMPYQQSRWLDFADGLVGLPAFQQHALCTTAQQRTVNYVLAGCNDQTPLHRVAITCRHHCCEMMASYALEGLVDWIVRDDSEAARQLRQETQFFILPFVDLDGVEAGDQGKGRQPRDHGRDYEGESIYPVTGAIRQLLPGFAAGTLRACLDLHCPWISGPRNEVIFLVGSPDERMATEQRRFSDHLAEAATGPLPVSPGDFLPFGTSWNTGDNHTDGIGFSGWAAGLPGVQLATGVELPYALAAGAEVNQETARRFGVDLGVALARWLAETSPLKGDVAH